MGQCLGLRVFCGGVGVVMEMRAAGQCRRVWGAGLWAALAAGGQRGACRGETRLWTGLWWHEEVACGAVLEEECMGKWSCQGGKGMGGHQVGAVVGDCGMLQLGEYQGEMGYGAVRGAERTRGEAMGRCWCTGALVRGRGELWGSRSGVRTWLRSWVCGSEGMFSGAGAWVYGAAAPFFLAIACRVLGGMCAGGAGGTVGPAAEALMF